MFENSNKFQALQNLEENLVNPHVEDFSICAEEISFSKYSANVKSSMNVSLAYGFQNLDRANACKNIVNKFDVDLFFILEAKVCLFFGVLFELVVVLGVSRAVWSFWLVSGGSWVTILGESLFNWRLAW
ncbi:hypothetical protein KFK09_006409 [Dendrobium nobile]|uniref:Uncharacterized protein n=1 Tax=Dendrobium nobile TaxID=94219 RepID=A0A8T3BR90_DENNO|nr:hypothetical protein KFK09_006409 [Dendrobium nobile]